MCTDIVPLSLGLDAIQRVLDRANTHGMRAFGHSYRKSKEINFAQHDVHAH